ncbi:aldose 1-epimerase [Exiguobacterium sp. PvP048]|uniref:aldose epimerase family protein n=1 Tax=unclassified Exiguobacterium TaxID=2644629 RepID=UPI00339B99E4
MQVRMNLQQDQSTRYRVKNDRGMEVEISSKGGSIERLIVPDRNGHPEDIMFNCYLTPVPVITRGLSGKLYDTSSGSVHEIDLALYQLLFTAEPFSTIQESVLRLSAEISVNGQVIAIDMLYALTNSNQLILRYAATTNQPLRLSLALPIFFNLSGNLKDSITQHDLKFTSSCFIHPVPTLSMNPCFQQTKGTPFDFRLGRRLHRFFLDKVFLQSPVDTYFSFHQQPVISVHEAVSGRWVTIETSHPGFVLSAAAHHTDTSFSGICFDSTDFLLSSLIRGSIPYFHETTYSFSTTY